MLILSFIVGILSGLAAILLKNAIHYTHYLLTHGFAKDSESYWYLVYPIIGIIITYIYVRYFVKDRIGHGVSRILYAISRNNSRIKPHNHYSSMIASTFTIGFGGSVGSEAPIVLTGASIGSNIGRLLRLNYKAVTLLVGCGAAGAIAGIFKAPLAGLVFTLEVLMIDLTMASIVPLLISAVTAATVAFFLMGKGVIFSYKIVDPFVLDNIPYLILLGIVTGFISLFFTRGAMKIEKQFERIHNPGTRILLGGIILSVLIFLFPPLYGEGYETIRALLSNESQTLAHSTLFYFVQDNFWFFALYLLLVLGFKVVAMSVTTGSGGVGGIFAPTLFMGGVSGYLFARLINSFSFVQVSEGNFALIGMSGLMAGVMHAPLTGIFLIAEITGGYTLFVPLMIVATISYLTIMPFEPHSIYTKRLARRGELITHHKDRAVLTLMRMGDVVEKDLKRVGPDQTLGDLVKVVSKSCRNIFPVVDEDNMLVGIVLLDNIRDIMFNQDMYDNTYVHELMILPPSYVSSDENMDSVMKKFEETGAWNLPVIDDGKYVGFVSKSKIFNAYRTLLVQFSDE
jgi:CIC family chloride channel protein